MRRGMADAVKLKYENVCWFRNFSFFFLHKKENRKHVVHVVHAPYIKI